MAASEVIQLDSESSEDEYENTRVTRLKVNVKKPPRVPIGWNYQSKASDKVVCMGLRYDSFPSATQKKKTSNGDVGCKASSKDDDLEIVEVTKKPVEGARLPKGTRITLLPTSSTRSEIRQLTRHATQASISTFFKKQPSPEVKKQPLPEVKKNGKDATSRRKEEVKVDKTEEREEESKPLRQNGRKEDDAEENSETSIAALENFVSRWEEIKSSKEDQKIREKLWKYYYLAHSSYVHSRKFIKLVETSTRKLTLDNIYVIIKDLLDSLKHYKDLPYGEKLPEEDGWEKKGDKNETATEAAEGEPAVELTEEEKKRNSRLRKVEKKMKEISDKIKELEKAEVDLDDEDNSAYLVEERLKRQFSKLHDYYCRIAQCSPATGRPIERKFKYQGSRYPEINKRISAWVNKNKEFPDYVDVLNLVKKVTKQSSLPLRPETVRVQAQEIFRDVGRILKERRESDDLYNIYGYAEEEVPDPAAEDDELSRKLQENETIAKEKLDKIFQDYVDKEAFAREAADKSALRVKTEVKEEKVGSVDTNSATAVEGTEVSKAEEDTCKQEDVKQENDLEEKEEEEEEEEEEDGEEEEEEEEEEGEEGDEGDEDGEDEEEEEDVEEQMTGETCIQDFEDDGDVTDDDLNDVLASACMEEEIEDSEEDVPIMDSEEAVYKDIAEDDYKNEEIICLDDDNDELEGKGTGVGGQLPAEGPADSSSATTSNASPSGLSEKRKLGSDSLSPHKRQCLGVENP
ncbi:death domain-associated protein 6-like [Penaeus chinensis]|uniref:death domain-associated protein 6-like n=1 Tax=Penaeus chinensis TaxID=139456 RepID=UPI001FB7628A|nr:death domain-associated protein 6-like [Penaeus chinensis]